MKHLITDQELIAYMEGDLSSEAEHQLIEKARENGELGLLARLLLMAEENQQDMANTLLGDDDFINEDEQQGSYQMAAKQKIDTLTPKKELL